MVDARSVRRVLIVLLASLAVMIAYWTLWFTARDAVASNDRPAYVEFENAFPLADAWLTVCLIGAAITVPARRPIALLWLLAGGGAGLYLFGMDVLYDLEHGIWWHSGAPGGVWRRCRQPRYNPGTWASSALPDATWNVRRRNVLSPAG